jgi:hypothetical protein
MSKIAGAYRVTHGTMWHCSFFCSDYYFAVRSALHAFLQSMYGAGNMILYLAGTRFEFQLTWHVLSAVTALADVELRFWDEFPMCSQEEVQRVLALSLRHVPSAKVARLLIGRGRLSYGLFDYLRRELVGGAAAGPAVVEAMVRTWYRTLLDRTVGVFKEVVRLMPEVEVDLENALRAVIANRGLPYCRGGLFPTTSRQGFFKVMIPLVSSVTLCCVSLLCNADPGQVPHQSLASNGGDA